MEKYIKAWNWVGEPTICQSDFNRDRFEGFLRMWKIQIYVFHCKRLN